MQLLANSLVAFENLSSPTEAVRYIREPWSSKAASPLAREWVDPSNLQHKKARLQQDTSQFSGNSSGLNACLSFKKFYYQVIPFTNRTKKVRGCPV